METHVPTANSARTDGGPPSGLSSYLYSSVQPYQTRLLKLHGDNGDRSSPLTCSIHVADILHTELDGFGVRDLDLNHGTGMNVEFEALSYTWGDPSKTQCLKCDQEFLPITKNLHEALNALRLHDTQSRWLWVDSVCINQRDDREKGAQVRNMFLIYQKATKVVAWLGQPNDEVEMLLSAGDYLKTFSSKDKGHASQPAPPIESICVGLQALYNKSWFQRIWVQQEIYAARILRFQCGSYQFDWYSLFSNPYMLMWSTQMNPYRQIFEQRKQRPKVLPPPRFSLWRELIGRPQKRPLRVENPREQIQEVLPEEVREQHALICSTHMARSDRLSCFERFREPECSRADLIDTLLDTSGLAATDSRDRIYGILGITGFPSRPMLIGDWPTLRKQEIFIPIDYASDMNMILAAVSWVVIMKGGLEVLATFQMFRASTSGHTESKLPSWVMDWELIGRCFKRNDGHSGPCQTITNAWHPWSQSEGANYSRGTKLFLGGNGDIPQAHQDFHLDNCNSSLPWNQLVVRGFVESRYRIQSRGVYDKSAPAGEAPIWTMDIEGRPTDIVVCFPAHQTLWSLKLQRIFPWIPALWVLRPTATENQFQLMACLRHKPQQTSWIEPSVRGPSYSSGGANTWWNHMYDYWIPEPSLLNDESQLRPRRLQVPFQGGLFKSYWVGWGPDLFGESNMPKLESGEMKTFILV